MVVFIMKVLGLRYHRDEKVRKESDFMIPEGLGMFGELLGDGSKLHLLSDIRSGMRINVMPELPELDPMIDTGEVVDHVAIMPAVFDTTEGEQGLAIISNGLNLRIGGLSVDLSTLRKIMPEANMFFSTKTSVFGIELTEDRVI